MPASGQKARPMKKTILITGAGSGIGRDAVEGMVNTFFKIVRDFSKELEASN